MLTFCIVISYDATGANPDQQEAQLLQDTFHAAVSVYGKVNGKITSINNELGILQNKAFSVTSDNQGKMKKLQRKSKILMDKQKDLESMAERVGGVAGLLQQRAKDNHTASMIASRAKKINGKLHFANEKDADMVLLLSFLIHLGVDVIVASFGCHGQC